ncbi:hypothetical protein MS2017_0542 [Bathymodiolus thermophilus thioautotrophic gill symbiont]|uniref:Uncharacterized protein n=1 Tax=Bathymodiolus thermophilus thioautotrophic gill symbiont TaxID=2360 RepID=A0A3G3IKK7_9GAMM|nr:hypothetical protein MS2017_0542 [Bathymodiolus thermophilus thioautotrophic gill symbiont]
MGDWQNSITAKQVKSRLLIIIHIYPKGLTIITPVYCFIRGYYVVGKGISYY